MLILLLTLAGCAGPSDESTTNKHSTGPALTDFWGAAERMTIMDDTISTTTFIGGSGGAWVTFWPTKATVPVGTASLTIVMSQVETFGKHDDVELRYQTAADDEWRDVEGFALGEPAQIPVRAGDADPPGQDITSWRFRLYYPPQNTQQATGSVSEAHVSITAHRGDALPALDARAPWTGERLELFSASGEASGAYNGDACYGVTGCPAPQRPAEPIPAEARFIEIKVDHAVTFVPEVRFHTGDSWTWHDAPRTLSAPTQTVFRVAVDEPDSIYASKSAWAFDLRGDAPTSADPTIGEFEWQAYALA